MKKKLINKQYIVNEYNHRGKIVKRCTAPSDYFETQEIIAARLQKEEDERYGLNKFKVIELLNNV